MASNKCPRCKGSGKLTVKTSKKCPKCRGLGSTKLQIGGGAPKGKDVCSKCKGSGKIQINKEKTCPQCSGEIKYLDESDAFCLDCDWDNLVPLGKR